MWQHHWTSHSRNSLGNPGCTEPKTKQPRVSQTTLNPGYLLKQLLKGDELNVGWVEKPSTRETDVDYRWESAAPRPSLRTYTFHSQHLLASSYCR